MLGGGVPKNFTQDVVVATDILGEEQPMHKYAMQITVADERDGALSGSTLQEACSWGKVDTTYEQMVYGEATTRAAAAGQRRLAPRRLEGPPAAQPERPVRLGRTRALPPAAPVPQWPGAALLFPGAKERDDDAAGLPRIGHHGPAHGPEPAAGRLPADGVESRSGQDGALGGGGRRGGRFAARGHQRPAPSPSRWWRTRRRPSRSPSVPDGAVAGLGAGRGYVDMSTVDAGTSRTIAAAAAAAGGRFLEAPVSGTKGPAEQATLIILAAGDRPLYDEAVPALEAMGKLHLFLGETGQAARLKLVVNMVMGGMMTAFSEGLALADRAGLADADLLQVLAAGALANPMFAVKGPLMVAGRDEPAFPLKHAQKDLRLALQLGDELGQPLATAAAANEVFKQARRAGLADRDFSAVHRVVAGRAAD